MKVSVTSHPRGSGRLVFDYSGLEKLIPATGKRVHSMMRKTGADEVLFHVKRPLSEQGCSRKGSALQTEGVRRHPVPSVIK